MNSSAPLLGSLASVSLVTGLFASGLPAQDDKPEHPPTDLSPWIDLFDGETLNGFTETGGRYDGTAKWSVEDGLIVGRPGDNRAGGLLYTEQRWHSFDFTFETKIDWPFDSGVFVRMSPDGKGAQVTLDWRPNGEIGGIYSDGWLEHRPEGASKFGRDAWNECRVRCTGDDLHLEFWIGEEKLTDFQLPPGTEGYAATGLLGVQVHPDVGSEDDAVRFRNLRLRELPVFDTREFEMSDEGFLAAKPDTGWMPLLDPELSKWQSAGDPAMESSGYRMEDGILRVSSKGTAPQLETREDFQDFEYRMEFRTARGANSGLFLRAARDGSNPAYSGCELQILDDWFFEKDHNYTLQDWQKTASLYGAVPANAGTILYPNGRWNTLEVRYVGSQLRARLNGVVLYDVDTHSLEPAQGAAFAERARTGFIGLQRHAVQRDEPHDYAWFKNVFVRRVKAD
ncbi:MAG: DUF1080 domain-containing protein [Planctomycetota bacterium]